jgi:prepilin-type N-terminal cleavage/methylation domain-containing protein
MIRSLEKEKNLYSEIGEKGFTLIEVIAVMILIGIIAAVIYSRVSSVDDTNKFTQANTIKNHIRYAQSSAMKEAEIRGIRCDGSNYWFFRTNQPDNAANQILIAGENNKKISLSDKNITMSAFTIYFDYLGKPYTAYASETSNTPLNSPLNIRINSIPASAAVNFSVTPETGFIQ